MPIYYINIDAKYTRGLDLISRRGKVKTGAIEGYMREVGATFGDQTELEQAIEKLVLEDDEASNITIVYDWIGIIEETDLDREVYGDEDICDSLTADPRSNGIWYKTGKAFYHD